MINVIKEKALRSFSTDDIFWVEQSLQVPIIIDTEIAKKNGVEFVSVQFLKKTFGVENNVRRPVYLNPSKSIGNSKAIDRSSFLNLDEQSSELVYYQKFFSNNTITNTSLNGNYQDLLFPVLVENEDSGENPVVYVTCGLNESYLQESLGDFGLASTLPGDFYNDLGTLQRTFPPHIINIFLLNKEREVLESYTYSYKESSYMTGTSDYYHAELSGENASYIPQFETFMSSINDFFDIQFDNFQIDENNRVLIEDTGITISQSYIEKLLEDEYDFLKDISLSFKVITGEEEGLSIGDLFEVRYDLSGAFLDYNIVNKSLRNHFFGNIDIYDELDDGRRIEELQYRNSPIKKLKTILDNEEENSRFVRIAVDISTSLESDIELTTFETKYFLIDKNTINSYYDALVLQYKDYFIKKNTEGRFSVVSIGNRMFQITFLDLAQNFINSIALSSFTGNRKIKIQSGDTTIRELFFTSSMIPNNSIIIDRDFFDFDLIYKNLFTRTFYFTSTDPGNANVRLFFGDIEVSVTETSASVDSPGTDSEGDAEEQNVAEILE